MNPSKKSDVDKTDFEFYTELLPIVKKTTKNPKFAELTEQFKCGDCNYRSFLIAAGVPFEKWGDMKPPISTRINKRTNMLIEREEERQQQRKTEDAQQQASKKAKKIALRRDAEDKIAKVWEEYRRAVKELN